MKKNILIVLFAVLVVALPFIFRREKSAGDWREGDPVLVVVSPHIAAIRDEFAEAFSKWHVEKYGSPVRIDWRAIGGTTEIMRYLSAEYVTAFRAYWKEKGGDLPESGAASVLDRKFNPDLIPECSPEELDDWKLKRDAWTEFRKIDDPSAFGCKIDVFFGGGVYDHSSAERQGLIVPAWPDGNAPVGIFEDEKGRSLIPMGRGGEIWRGKAYYGVVLSSFGIDYNPDRLKDLGIENPPRVWRDLADPRFYGQIGVADPTKSGSITKAFEIIVHSECRLAVEAAGFTRDDILRYEKFISEARLPVGIMPDGVPDEYQEAVERGWRNGLELVRMIGANARYFTDGAGKVPTDVAAGDAAAGISIDFYGRVQGETMRSPTGIDRLIYVTPAGESSISADPVSLLRGAEHRELAVRFIEFILGEDGQKLWNYKPGEPGGPTRFSLRRMPIRRDFYVSDEPDMMATAEEHSKHTSDNLLDPWVDCYALSGGFDYIPRWTASHFGFLRIMIRSMCMDSGEELRSAWQSVIDAGGPKKCPDAMAKIRTLPPGITWASAPKSAAGDTMDISREWTMFFRNTYRASEKDLKK